MQANMNWEGGEPRRCSTMDGWPRTHCTTCCTGRGPVGTCPFPPQPSPAQGPRCASLAASSPSRTEGFTGQSCPGASPSPLRGRAEAGLSGPSLESGGDPFPRGSLCALTFRPLALLSGPDGRALSGPSGSSPQRWYWTWGGGLLSLPCPKLSAPPPICPALPLRLRVSALGTEGPPLSGCLPPGGPQTCPPSDRSSPGTRAVFPTGLRATALSPHALLVSHTHSAQDACPPDPRGASPRITDAIPRQPTNPAERAAPTHSPMEMGTRPPPPGPGC